MANYTEEDKRAFKLKDQMNCRQSALKAASVNNEGKGISAEDMLAESDKYYAWLYPQEIEEKPAKTTLPTPTAAQAKVLSKIAKGLDKKVEDIKGDVLDFAEKNFNIRKYPENVNSVDIFVKALK